jgi:hypothetical protein
MDVTLGIDGILLITKEGIWEGKAFESRRTNRSPAFLRVKALRFRELVWILFSSGNTARRLKASEQCHSGAQYFVRT